MTRVTLSTAFIMQGWKFHPSLTPHEKDVLRHSAWWQERENLGVWSVYACAWESVWLCVYVGLPEWEKFTLTMSGPPYGLINGCGNGGALATLQSRSTAGPVEPTPRWPLWPPTMEHCLYTSNQSFIWKTEGWGVLMKWVDSGKLPACLPAGMNPLISSFWSWDITLQASWKIKALVIYCGIFAVSLKRMQYHRHAVWHFGAFKSVRAL